jgi:hypothetical protein
MRIANLLLYLLVLFAALTVTWLMFQHFPFLIIPHDTIERFFSEDLKPLLARGWDYRLFIIGEYSDVIQKSLATVDWGQHVLAYLLAGALSMVVLRWGEWHIFHVQSKTNWKIVFPIWFLPVACLGTVIAPRPDDYHGFLIVADFAVVGVIGIYALWYHGVRAFRASRSS